MTVQETPIEPSSETLAEEQASAPMFVNGPMDSETVQETPSETVEAEVKEDEQPLSEQNEV
jgi:hypothetical protein